MKLTNKEQLFQKSLRVANIVRMLAFGTAALLLLPIAALVVFVVPAPSPETATEVSGKLIYMSEPTLNSDDLNIKLDDGRNYYVNRAPEVDYFNWRQLKREVKPGETLHLTAVRPLAWRLMHSELPKGKGWPIPVAGIRSENKVFMDETKSAALWVTQSQMQNYAILAMVIIALCVSPELFRLLQRWTSAQRNA